MLKHNTISFQDRFIDFKKIGVKVKTNCAQWKKKKRQETVTHLHAPVTWPPRVNCRASRTREGLIRGHRPFPEVDSPKSERDQVSPYLPPYGRAEDGYQLQPRAWSSLAREVVVVVVDVLCLLLYIYVIYIYIIYVYEKHEGDPRRARLTARLRPVLARLPVVLHLRHLRSGGLRPPPPPAAPPPAPPPPAADGGAEGGPEPAVHVESVPQRRGAGRPAQAAPEVRLQHGAPAEAVRRLGAPPAGLPR